MQAGAPTYIAGPLRDTSTNINSFRVSSLVVKINITTPPLTTSGTVYCIVYDSGVANTG